jgi:hypothetical protein
MLKFRVDEWSMIVNVSRFKASKKALFRVPAALFVAACLAGLVLFASYCRLHALAAGVVLPWTTPLTWGLETGVPAGALLYALWHMRGSSRLTSSGVGLTVFSAAIIWGVLARAGPASNWALGAGHFVNQFFAVSPVAALLAAVSAMILMTRRHQPAQVISPWIPLPEEPMLRLRPDQVTWISAAGNYCEFHTWDRVHLVRVPLVCMAERLKAQGFARVHRSAVVNMSTVESIERSSTSPRPVARLRCGTTVPVGRRFRAELLAAADSRSAQQ